MTHDEMQKYAAMEADCDRLRKLLEFQDIQIANQADTLAEMNRQIEMRRENNFGLHRRNVRLAEALRGIVPDEMTFNSSPQALEKARRALDSQNAGAMARGLAAQHSDNTTEIDG